MIPGPEMISAKWYRKKRSNGLDQKHPPILVLTLHEKPVDVCIFQKKLMRSGEMMKSVKI